MRSCREKGSKKFESVTWLFLTATLCSMPFLFKIHFSFPADVFWNGSPYSPEKHLQTLYLFFYASIRSFITWNRDLEKINNWIYQKQVQLHLGYKYKEREYTFSKKVWEKTSFFLFLTTLQWEYAPLKKFWDPCLMNALSSMIYRTQNKRIFQNDNCLSNCFSFMKS